METSPHAWSKPRRNILENLDTRNISTCVEQTHFSGWLQGRLWKHLHMRGANRAPPGRTPATPETSPHAWSKRLLRPDPRQVPGNISTCVEQTQRKSSALRDFRNISTCVEQTLQKPNDDPQIEKHLHMRGANLFCPGIFGPCVETSPHAWSKPEPTHEYLCEDWKHLHMRGANSYGHNYYIRGTETSPHAWSKPCRLVVARHKLGNISTCVEQTTLWSCRTHATWKHLHMRGANSALSLRKAKSSETSPHAWSKQRHLGASYQRYAICSSSNPR